MPRLNKSTPLWGSKIKISARALIRGLTVYRFKRNPLYWANFVAANKIQDRLPWMMLQYSQVHKIVKGAGSSNVNKLLSKRRFGSIVDSLYHGDFPLLFSNLKCYFEDGLLNFVEKQTKHSYVVELQRYWWIFRSNFIVDSPHPPKSERNTMATYGQQYRS